jgi:hypothetical protein
MQAWGQRMAGAQWMLVVGSSKGPRETDGIADLRTATKKVEEARMRYASSGDVSFR